MPPRDQLTRLSGLLLDGTAWKLPDLSARLGVSDATVTRLLASLGDRVLSIGERRGRRYFGRLQTALTGTLDVIIIVRATQTKPEQSARKTGDHGLGDLRRSLGGKRSMSAL